MAVLLNALFGSLTLMCVCVLATLGITLIFKTSFTTNFAQGAIAALGCYVTAAFLNSHGIPFWAGILIGMVVGCVFGVLVDWGIFRHGRNVNLLGKQIITMGLVSLITNFIPLVFGTGTVQSHSFIEGHQTFELGGSTVSITNNSLVCAAITVVVVTLIFVLLKKSKWGLGVRATASNEYVAGMMGVNTRMITAISWGIAGALGVLAACMYESTASIAPLFMTKIQVYAFLAGILGGFATFYGPVVGAVAVPLLGVLVGWLSFYVNGLSNWNEVIVYLMVLVIVLIRPQGLFGKKVAKKV